MGDAFFIANRVVSGIAFGLQATCIYARKREMKSASRVLDEPRSIVLGMHAGKIWAAVMTPRSGKIRIISVRRARDEERALYESF